MFHFASTGCPHITFRLLQQLMRRKNKLKQNNRFFYFIWETFFSLFLSLSLSLSQFQSQSHSQSQSQSLFLPLSAYFYIVIKSTHSSYPCQIILKMIFAKLCTIVFFYYKLQFATSIYGFFLTNFVYHRLAIIIIPHQTPSTPSTPFDLLEKSGF